jgi:hypothetical protein
LSADLISQLINNNIQTNQEHKTFLSEAGFSMNEQLKIYERLASKLPGTDR